MRLTTQHPIAPLSVYLPVTTHHHSTDRLWRRAGPGRAGPGWVHQNWVKEQDFGVGLGSVCQRQSSIQVAFPPKKHLDLLLSLLPLLSVFFFVSSVTHLLPVGSFGRRQIYSNSAEHAVGKKKKKNGFPSVIIVWKNIYFLSLWQNCIPEIMYFTVTMMSTLFWVFGVVVNTHKLLKTEKQNKVQNILLV